MGAGLAAVGLVMLAAMATTQRTYHDVAPGDFPTAYHTHVCTVGTVALKKAEKDGDIHLRIEAGGAFIVAEVIPTLPVPTVRLVKVGQRVRACGIRRFDDDSPGHHWWELHPVERLEILK